jgi:hypothetical protein
VIDEDGSNDIIPSALIQAISLLQDGPRMSVIQTLLHNVAHGLSGTLQGKHIELAKVLADLFKFKVVVDPSATNTKEDGIYLELSVVVS